MRTVKSLMDALALFPPDAKVYAYEGEIIGLIVVGKGREPLGEIDASSDDEEEVEVRIIQYPQPRRKKSAWKFWGD